MSDKLRIPFALPTYTNSNFPNPFQGPGAEDAWRRLRASRGNVVTREEMMRRVQEQAAKKK
ncbi:hypothetical protein A0257_03485 [Hymenobacter psoromatis]|nr:hypothetical protein A0257_03485 [Hymenobacter psoromatis]